MTDWKNRVQDPDHWSGPRHFNLVPKQAKNFRMKTVNKPSKRDSRAFEKAISMITQGIQTNFPALIRKIHSGNRDHNKKRTSKLYFKIPTSRSIRDCHLLQLANDSRLSRKTTRECTVVFATVYKDNPWMHVKFFSETKKKSKDFQKLSQVKTRA